MSKVKLIIESVSPSIIQRRAGRQDPAILTRAAGANVRLLPRQYLNSDGEIELEIDCEKQIPLQYATDDQTDINSIKSNEAALLEVDGTAINLRALGDFNSEHVEPSVYLTKHPFRLQLGSKVYMQGNLTLQSSKTNLHKKQSTAKLQLLGETAQWAEQLSDLPINQLDFGGDGDPINPEAITVSTSNLFTGGLLNGTQERSTVNFNQYNGIFATNRQFVPLLVNYGYFNGGESANTTISDYRLWIFAADIIFLMFAKLGYKVRSRFMNSRLYRSKVCYLLRENYWAQDVANVANMGFYANWTTDEVVTVTANSPKKIVADNDILAPGNDPSNQYNTTGPNAGSFIAAALIHVRFHGTIILKNNGAVQHVVTLVAAGKTITNLQTILPGETYTQNFATAEMILNGFSASLAYKSVDIRLSLGFGDFGSDISVLQGSYWAATVSYVEVFEGSQIRLRDIISPDHTCLNFLKGEAHIHDLKFMTDAQNRIVYIEPESDSYLIEDAGLPTFRFDTIQGFYFDDTKAIDITPAVDNCSDIIITQKLPSLKKNLRLSYQTDDDYMEYVNEKYYSNSDNLGLYDCRRFMGSLYPDGETKSENPFYAATANNYYNKLSHDTPSGALFTEQAVYIPHIWNGLDANDGIGLHTDNNATKIIPRCLYIFGRKSGKVLHDTGNGNLIVYDSYLMAAMADIEAPLQTINGKLYINTNTLSYGPDMVFRPDKQGTAQPIAEYGANAANTYRRTNAFDMHYAAFIAAATELLQYQYGIVPQLLPHQFRYVDFRYPVRIENHYFTLLQFSFNLADMGEVGKMILRQRACCEVVTADQRALNTIPPISSTTVQITNITASPCGGVNNEYSFVTVSFAVSNPVGSTSVSLGISNVVFPQPPPPLPTSHIFTVLATGQTLTAIVTNNGVTASQIITLPNCAQVPLCECEVINATVISGAPESDGTPASCIGILQFEVSPNPCNFTQSNLNIYADHLAGNPIIYNLGTPYTILPDIPCPPVVSVSGNVFTISGLVKGSYIFELIDANNNLSCSQVMQVPLSSTTVQITNITASPCGGVNNEYSFVTVSFAVSNPVGSTSVSLGISNVVFPQPPPPLPTSHIFTVLATGQTLTAIVTNNGVTASQIITLPNCAQVPLCECEVINATVISGAPESDGTPASCIGILQFEVSPNPCNFTQSNLNIYADHLAGNPIIYNLGTPYTILPDIPCPPVVSVSGNVFTISGLVKGSYIFELIDANNNLSCSQVMQVPCHVCPMSVLVTRIIPATNATANDGEIYFDVTSSCPGTISIGALTMQVPPNCHLNGPASPFILCGTEQTAWNTATGSNGIQYLGGASWRIWGLKARSYNVYIQAGGCNQSYLEFVIPNAALLPPCFIGIVRFPMLSFAPPTYGICMPTAGNLAFDLQYIGGSGTFIVIFDSIPLLPAQYTTNNYAPSLWIVTITDSTLLTIGTHTVTITDSLNPACTTSRQFDVISC